MPAGSYLDLERARFADQFVPEGRDYRFRRNKTGPAFFVTVAERDTFLADFDRRLRVAFWAFVAAIIFVLSSFTAGAFLFDIDVNHGIWGIDLSFAMIGSVIAYLAFNLWSFGVPGRELAHRTPVADALPTAERRRLFLNSLSWPWLAGGMAIFLWQDWMALRRHPSAASSWVTLIICNAGIVILAVRAVQKWRLDHAA